MQQELISLKKFFDVILIGNYSIDLVFSGFPTLPRMGVDVRSKDFTLIPGESYTNAVVMHRLGISVGWAADFGNDELSQIALRFIRVENLDESLFFHHSFPLKRISTVISNDNDRGFITYYDPNPGEHAFHKVIQNITGSILMIPGLNFVPEILKFGSYCRGRGIKIYLDANMGADMSLDNPEIQGIIPWIDVLLPNSREVKVLTGETDLLKGIRILAKHFPLVIAKDGENGSFACDGHNLLHVPSIKMEANDTTGAGDCFDCGFVKARLDNQKIEDCLKWGNIVGAISTLACGGSGRKITIDEVRRTLSQSYT